MSTLLYIPLVPQGLVSSGVHRAFMAARGHAQTVAEDVRLVMDLYDVALLSL